MAEPNDVDMKKIIFYCVGLAFPFIAFLILDLPGPALFALALQSTGIGWPVAMIWVFKNIRRHYAQKRNATPNIDTKQSTATE